MFPRPDDGCPQLTSRMRTGRHQSWTGCLNISNRTGEQPNHPQTVRIVIASAPYRYRSFSGGRTHNDCVSEKDIGLPTSLTDISQMSGSFSDAMCSRVTGLKSGHASPCVGFSMSRDHYLKTFTSGFHFGISLWDIS